MNRSRASKGAVVVGVGLATFSALSMIARTAWVDGHREMLAGEVGKGMPAIALLARAALAIPVGGGEHGLGLVAALFAALAAAAIAATVLEIAPRGGLGQKLAAAAGAIAAGGLTATALATVSRGAMVWAVTASFAALALFLATRVLGDERRWSGAALALVVGLGLGTHPAFALLAGVPLLAVFVVCHRRGHRWVLAVPLIVVLSAGALFVTPLVVPAATRIAPLVSAPSLAAAEAPSAIRAAHALELRLGLLAFAAAAAGVIALVRLRRGWTLALLTPLAAGLALALLGGRFADPELVLLPCLALAALAGAGIAWAPRRLGPAAPAASTAFALIVCVEPLWMLFERL